MDAASTREMIEEIYIKSGVSVWCEIETFILLRNSVHGTKTLIQARLWWVSLLLGPNYAWKVPTYLHTAYWEATDSLTLHLMTLKFLRNKNSLHVHMYIKYEYSKGMNVKKKNKKSKKIVNNLHPFMHCIFHKVELMKSTLKKLF